MKKTLTQKIRGTLKYAFKTGLDHKTTTFRIHLLILDFLGEMPIDEPADSKINKWIEENL